MELDPAGGNAAGGGGEAAAVDIAFLDRQTFGDPLLRAEIVTLYLAQQRRLVDEMDAAAPEHLRELAHRLTGAARGVGANRVAALAGAIAHPGPEGTPAGTFAALREAAREVESILGGLM